MPLTYTLSPGAKPAFGSYSRAELELLTTYRLGELCRKERIVLSGVNTLDKEALIRLILRFRGRHDALYIEDYSEEGWERISKIIARTEQKTPHHDARVPAKITVFRTLGLTRADACRLILPDANEPGIALLICDEGKLRAVFHLAPERGESEYSLLQSGSLPVESSNRKNYRLLVFDRRDSDILHSIYHNPNARLPVQLRAHALPVLDFEVREPLETLETLCIDFGTSNTTVGFFADASLSSAAGAPFGATLIAPEAINLLTVEDGEGELTPLIPSAVGISGIEAGSVRYKFGHEAMRFLNAADDTLSLFCDIKRWVSDPERIEELTDKFGNRVFLARKEILRRYFQHIITLAQRRFKCNFRFLHISCPVKQKQRFTELFEDILEGYIIETQNALDEGASVLYNTISNLITSDAYENRKPYKALIIDCGGGTTDLSSCTFQIENNRVSYDIRIETAYEDGDTDFGGNNLTFRIFQLLKVLWAQSLLGAHESEFVSISYKKPQRTLEESSDEIGVYFSNEISIFDAFDSDVYRAVDEKGAGAIYAALDERYALAESVVPTRYKLFESRDRSEYFKVKANFYFLFDTAERVKTAFFSNPRTIGICVTCAKSAPKGLERLGVEPWKLSRESGETLKTLRETPEIILNALEIRRLFMADVYSIVRKFLHPLYKENALYDYSIIKLTGQSCKVDLFRDALKEFVPGRLIEFSAIEKGRYELKLACLKGAIAYLNSKKQGYANVSISSRLSALPYSVLAYTHTGEEATLIYSKNALRTEGFISRHMERLTLKLYLLDSEARQRCEYQYNCDPADFTPVTYEEIPERFRKKIPQDETDNIVTDEVKFFAFAAQELWGFYIVPVCRLGEQLRLGKSRFFQFENDVWEQNFFDGMK